MGVRVVDCLAILSALLSLVSIVPVVSSSGLVILRDIDVISRDDAGGRKQLNHENAVFNQLKNIHLCYLSF